MGAKSNADDDSERRSGREPRYATPGDDVPPELYGWFVDGGELLRVVRGP